MYPGPAGAPRGSYPATVPTTLLCDPNHPFLSRWRWRSGWRSVGSAPHERSTTWRSDQRPSRCVASVGALPPQHRIRSGPDAWLCLTGKAIVGRNATKSGSGRLQSAPSCPTGATLPDKTNTITAAIPFSLTLLHLEADSSILGAMLGLIGSAQAWVPMMHSPAAANCRILLERIIAGIVTGSAAAGRHRWAGPLTEAIT